MSEEEDNSEIRGMATQMITAIKKIWPDKPVTTVVIVLTEVQVRMLRVGGGLTGAEAVEALMETLKYLKDKEVEGERTDRQGA